MSLSLFSPLAYVVILGILILAAHLLTRIPFYKKHAEEGVPQRFVSLDGLRGLLALGVFFQHAVTNYQFFQKGIWQITDVRFYRHLGGEAVILFFMITSFLYWSKAIHQKGTIDVAQLYTSRFLRLAPMYLFSALLVVFSVFLQTGFSSDVVQTAKDLLSWFSLGLITTTTVNGASVLPINAGIHWTLHFEWLFYLFLPVTALALKDKTMRLMAFPVLIFAMLSSYWGYWIIFLFGIAAAHIVSAYSHVSFFTKRISSFVPIIGLLLVYWFQYKPYSLPQYFISLGILLSFIYGADLFGLLKTKAVQLLGTISYSIYLLHGIVLFGVLHTVNKFYPVLTMTPLLFWGLIFVSGLLTVLVSTVTYQYIEYPFIQKIKSSKVSGQRIEMTERVM